MLDISRPICLRSADRLAAGDVITIDGTPADEVVRVVHHPYDELPEHVYIRTRTTAWVRHDRELIPLVATHVAGIGYVVGPFAHPVFGTGVDA